MDNELQHRGHDEAFAEDFEVPFGLVSSSIVVAKS